MPELYFISGLGADHRVFQFLKPEKLKKNFIHWIVPLENESIEAYAKRLSEQIKTKRPILIGLSFGGIIAIEIAKLIEIEKVILISSVKTKKEIPFYFRIAGKLKLHRILKAGLLKRGNIIFYWFFGTKTESERLILKSILADADSYFLYWAIDKIVSWTNETNPDNLKHIHGTADKIFPSRFVQADNQINGGGHFMVMNRADEITEMLNEYL